MDHECDNCYGTGFIGDGISAKACHCSPHLFSNNQPSPNLNAARTEIVRLAAENAELRESLAIVRRLASEDSVSLSERLATANATLDKLRKVVPRNMRQRGYGLNQLESVHTILYPQPERRSVRAIADANGFAPMPDELSQSSVDGETNSVTLKQENEV